METVQKNEHPEPTSSPKLSFWFCLTVPLLISGAKAPHILLHTHSDAHTHQHDSLGIAESQNVRNPRDLGGDLL